MNDPGPRDPAPEAGGRIRRAALIPGATYRITDRTEAKSSGHQPTGSVPVASGLRLR